MHDLYGNIDRVNASYTKHVDHSRQADDIIITFIALHHPARTRAEGRAHCKSNSPVGSTGHHSLFNHQCWCARTLQMTYLPPLTLTLEEEEADLGELE